MQDRKYYHAYEDRYRQVHDLNLQWSFEKPSDIVRQTMERYGISKNHKIIEIGCGEGRDALPLLTDGYDLLATDVSKEAIRYCQEKVPEYAAHFQMLDCIEDKLAQRFDFIYAVAVLHMLVEEIDRDGFYGFIREHLKSNGIALICTMGDGQFERKSDISTAFELQERFHQESGQTVNIAGTSCRMVSFDTLSEELKRNHLIAVEQGICSDEPNFDRLMYTVVKKSNLS